jgi:hypothetical protein
MSHFGHKEGKSDAYMHYSIYSSVTLNTVTLKENIQVNTIIRISILVLISFHSHANLKLEPQSDKIDIYTLSSSESIWTFGLYSLFYIHPPGECVPYGCRGYYIFTYPAIGELEGETKRAAKKISGEWNIHSIKNITQNYDYYMEENCLKRIDSLIEITYSENNKEKKYSNIYISAYHTHPDGVGTIEVKTMSDIEKIKGNCLG